jgi:hypothetical protein
LGAAVKAPEVNVNGVIGDVFISTVEESVELVIGMLGY